MNLFVKFREWFRKSPVEKRMKYLGPCYYAWEAPKGVGGGGGGAVGPDCFIVFPFGVMIISLNIKAIY